MLKISLSQLVSTVGFTLLSYSVSAQIVPDNSLGSESSIVTPNVTVKDTLVDSIAGGAVRGNNLFHSFSEFNISDGTGVYFANPDGITNILTRVTGNNVSEILGTLGVNGAANLFLLNPNGIIFGESAALDVSGSFLATTADSYVFENGFKYSATNLEVPLLTIDVPVGIQMGANSAAIEVKGTGNNLRVNEFTFTPIRDNRPVGLEVEAGNTLALLGGEINLVGGNLTAARGNIELGSVKESATISLIPSDRGFGFDYGEIDSFENLNLTQAASIDVSGSGGGNINLRGKHISVLDGSAIVANTLGTDNGGNINLTASESIEVVGAEGELFPSSIFSLVEVGAIGNGGNLAIDAKDYVEITGAVSTSTFGVGKGGDLTINSSGLSIENGGQMGTGTFGAGDSGDLTVNADLIEIKGASVRGFPSGLFSTVEIPSATGKGGNLTVNSSSLVVDDGGLISAATSGEGKGGNLTVNSSSGLSIENGGQMGTGTFGAGDSGDLSVDADSIEIKGTSALGFTSALSSTVGVPSATGKGGNLTVNSSSLVVENGGQIGTGTFGAGDSGDLTVDADSIEIKGASALGFPSGLFSTVEVPSATGKGGNLSINSNSLIVEDGGSISSATIGEGKGGNLLINVEQLTIQQGASQVAASTFGNGDSGDLIVNASKSIEISGTGVLPSFEVEGEYNLFSSGLFASVELGAKGNGGNLAINTKTLNISEGGKIVANTLGTGNAGDISIEANNLEVKGTVVDNIGTRSGINSTVEFEGSGSGGNLDIVVNTLNLIDGGSIAVDAKGQGNAGDINLQAQKIDISGVSSPEPVHGFEQKSLPSEISASSLGNYDAGSITIDTKTLKLYDSGNISVSNLGNGNSGNLNITASELNLNNFATIEAKVNAGTQGNINLLTDSIFLRNNGEINAKATGTATGGNITIDNVDNIVLRDNSKIIADAIQGNGGNIDITTQGLFISPNSLISASSEFGLDGNVEIDEVNGDRKFELDRLPENVTDLTNLITVACSADDNNALAVIGKGGIPNSPYQTQSLNTTWYDLRPVKKTSNTASQPAPITEATTTIIDADGELALVALTPLSTHRWINSSCPN